MILSSLLLFNSKSELKNQGYYMQIQSLQIALFFKELLNERPDLKFRSLSEKFSYIFDNMPTQFPIPLNAPSEIPFMMLTSRNNLNSCNISKSRIDFITNDLEYMNNEEFIVSYLDEITKSQDIIQFGFVSTYFDKSDMASKLIKDEFLIVKDDTIKDISVRYNKPIEINKEIYNCHFSVSDVTQQQILSQNIEKGLLMQKDINNVSLNLKNEVLTSSKLKSLFKGACQILYSSEINVK